CGWGAVFYSLLQGAHWHVARHLQRDLGVTPARNSRRYSTNGYRPSRRAKAIVARDGLQVVWSGCGRGTGVRVVGYHLVAQGRDSEDLTGTADPWSNPIPIHFLNRRRGIRIGAVRIVVPRTREGGRGHYRRIHVLRLSRHERDLVAEVAVLRVKQRIGSRSRSGVVHTGDHHGGRITRRVGRVDFPGRVGQAVIGAPLVGIHAGNLVSSPILDGYGQVGRGEFLAELRRERVEFRSVVVGDNAGEVRGDVSRSEYPELRQHGRLVLKDHFLAVAQVARRSRERRHFPGLREQADEVG